MNVFGAINQIKTDSDCKGITHKTLCDYINLSQHLMKKRRLFGKTLSELVNETRSKNTYFKRITALKTYLFWIGADALENLLDANCEQQKAKDSARNMKLAARDLAELLMIIKQGHINERAIRKSKRKAY